MKSLVQLYSYRAYKGLETQDLEVHGSPECLARKLGHYPTGNRESLNYFEQKVTQSAPCFRQVL